MARNRDGQGQRPPFLPVALAAALRCGVTRLADITGLDRLGLPVWQTIRPASRALSVHQGKALTPAGAQIGALCEAIESHCAEQVDADGPHCALAALPPAERLADPGDLLVDRDRAPCWDEPIAWCIATDLASGRVLHLPHAFVSLDLRGRVFSLIERSSNGLGAGPDEAYALTNALMELIERDALVRWNRAGLAVRIASRIEPASIPFDWFRHWRERLAVIGAELDAFELETLTGTPAFRCTINGGAAFANGRRLTVGSAAHPQAELALAKAVAEAAQVRLTLIAGARDDLFLRHYRELSDPPESEGWLMGRPWRERVPPDDPIGATVEQLAAQGYRQVAVKRLDRHLDGVAVVKAFVPGLGLFGRTRRVPA